jgi:RHS repeat-associated protein
VVSKKKHSGDSMNTNEQNTDNKDEFYKTDGGKSQLNTIDVPSIELPKGGGAIKGIDEKLTVNAVNGTVAFTVALPFTPARGMSPGLSLSYNTGFGNSIFGLGWSLSLGSIKRKTNNGLPEYNDSIESDVFILTDSEDLVPEFKKGKDGRFVTDKNGEYCMHEKESSDGLFIIRYYKPRIEGLFARIERWSAKASGLIKWRTITRNNLTTLFGWSRNSIISDPKDTTRIFEWLPEFVFDDKGNCEHYIYKKEDMAGVNPSLVHNRNRVINGTILYTNCYLEKVLYGNTTPYKKFGDIFPSESDYVFQTVFDYGEYDTCSPYGKIKEWDYRFDSFSDYKAGFEIRTTRLCKRVLLFHMFTNVNEYNGLVKSINFEYDTVPDDPFSFLKSITEYGYIKKPDGTYTHKKMPPIEFEYQKPRWNKKVKKISEKNLANAPSGLDEPHYQFTDLFNEGLAGILTEQSRGWYYKSNLGNGEFTPAELVTPKPSFVGLGRQLYLTDLDGDGGKQLVSLKPESKGYFELNDDNEWQPFRPFKRTPNVNLVDPNARMIDLNNDGKAEMLISDHGKFTWYKSEGRKGFSEGFTTIKSFDEEKGPHVVFADSTQSVFLADMSGDGLTDIVRIRNGEVCYWPNLGFGKFGAKITMDHAPIFDHPSSFNPAFLRLADIDGSGIADIIYLGKNKFTCWFNISGNAFSECVFEIDAFPEIHTNAKITVTDLLGTGVASIVWSSSLPANSRSNIQYIDLLGSKKPHIMIAYKNNFGKEVSMEYKASTFYYLEDKKAGKPWITKLHFPVHCLSKLITLDKVTGWCFEQSYKYHHGYYDHHEREFRGFGMVEQIDSETFENRVVRKASNYTDKKLHQEPVITKTWFHTGAFDRQEKILTQFAGEYWQEEMKKQGFTVVNHETELPDARIIAAPGIPDSCIEFLSTDELRQAFRSCKSMILHSEVFANDAPVRGATCKEIKKQLTPYVVTSNNCFIELLQPKGKNRYAVFVVKESESITYNYERNTDDPRIAHTLNIKLDELGNVLESASVVYPRLRCDISLPSETQQEQRKTVVVYLQKSYTNDVIANNVYRLRLPGEIKTYELKGVSKMCKFYKPCDFNNILTNKRSDTVAYQEIDKEPSGKPQKRLIEHARTTYYSNNLRDSLPLNQLDSLGFTFEIYQLAYTPELLKDIFGSIDGDDSKVNDALMLEGKFTHSEGDSNWWIRSGTSQFIEENESVSDAQNRFFSPVSYTDPYGSKTRVKYYSDYFLSIQEVEDAFGNKSSVDLFNFRTLSPRRMRDINNNLSEAIVDELGLVKATAVMGKDNNNDGIGDEADDLTGLTEYTEQEEMELIKEYFTVPKTIDGVTDSVKLTRIAKQLLMHASSRFLYNLNVFRENGKPVVAASIIREEHYRKNENSPVQLSFEYSNGIGSVVMKKMQAEPGLAKKVIINPDCKIEVEEIDTSTLNPPLLRWIGNGRTILNNKGNAVKQYEPYFSVSNKYENEKMLVETGVTPIHYYDSLGRIIKTEMPDNTFSKMEFDSWKQVIYDSNDTVLSSEWYCKRINRLIDDELMAEGKDPVREKNAAEKAARHANTPRTLHLDSLGRTILSIELNVNPISNTEECFRTKKKVDTEGNLRALIDSRELKENDYKGNTVVQFKYDILGNKVYQKSMDTGQRWLLANILGNPLRTWDERDHEFQYHYDILHRPVEVIVINAVGKPGDQILNNVVDRIIYGESLLLPGRSNEAELQNKNVLGKTIQHYDTGGLIDTPEYDFNNQPLFTTRKLFKNYKTVANWTNTNLTSDLETDAFTFVTETDALGRITNQTLPDESIITSLYNESGSLNQVKVLHSGASSAETYIRDIDYNEKGQRKKIIYGNDVFTQFYYDTKTFRLNRLESKRKNGDPLQDWHYTFDPVGNITHIEDKNIPVVFFDNQKVTGLSEYTYDSSYRLIAATGRENCVDLTFTDDDNWNDAPFMMDMNPGDPMAMRNYQQQYHYDEVGNILKMQHQSVNNNWTRNYNYEKLNNRIKSTVVGDTTNYQNYTNYKHHPTHGFLIQLPHLQELEWNFEEKLVMSTQQKVNPVNGTAETTWYQYDSSGKRIRKINENQASAGMIPTKKDERIYISGYELYKKHSGPDAGLERTTVSLIDQGNRFVMIETRNEINDGTEKRLVRYQLHNHLGSACLELDNAARVISYEEYHPYGTTSYQAKNRTIKSSAKRYRYTGVERDEETGFENHNARYYMPWLARWLSADPIGVGGGVNVYEYGKSNPLTYNDTSGMQSDPPEQMHLIESMQVSTVANRTSFEHYSMIGKYFNNLAIAWGEDPQDYVRGHDPATPQYSTPAGSPQIIRPQTATSNALQSVSERSAAQAIRASNERLISSGQYGPLQFIREDYVDVNAPRFQRYGSTLPAEVRSFAQQTITPPAIALSGSSGAPQPDLPATVSLPIARTGQLSFAFVEEESPQLSFNFTAGASSRSSSASSATATSAGSISQQLEFDFDTPSSRGTSSTAGSGGVSAPRFTLGPTATGGLGALGRSTPVVGEAVVVTEGALLTAAYYAPTPALTSGLLTAAEVTPVIAGVGVIGAGSGHAVRYIASEAGADETTADSLGFVGAVGVGAALGSVVPGVGTAVGAVAGGVVAGGLYLFSIWD